MDLSLIVCTRNRAGPLRACLEAIGEIEFDREWQFVLVDNGSSDDTAAVARDFVGKNGIRPDYVFEGVAGLSNARNAGLRAARGAIIAFTDDDCYPAADFLQRIMAAFDDSTIGYTTGRIMLHDPTDFPATINESLVPLRFAARSYLAPGAVKGANLAFRSSALHDCGGFDPLFGSGALFPSEDVDTAARVGRAGWAGCYDPSIVVSHHHGRKAADIGSLYKAYAIGRGAYHAKLLLSDHALRQSLKGWRGIIRRGIARPGDIRWELTGAWRWIFAKPNPSDIAR